MGFTFISAGSNTYPGIFLILELKDDLSIEEALDAIIQEEDLSHSKTTLEIKETDDEIEISDEDSEAAKK